MADDDKKQRAVRHLLTRMSVDGVAAVKVSDGHVYGFTAERLRSLLASAESSEEKMVIVFVKSGGEISDEKDN